MFEKFTDRARKVMALAVQEARIFNHECIGSEHILDGLCREGSGVAALVLRNHEIDPRALRQEIEKEMQSGPDTVGTAGAFRSPQAEKIIEYAIQEAHNLHHDQIGTGHLLVGVMLETEGVGAQTLRRLGLAPQKVREELASIDSSGRFAVHDDPSTRERFPKLTVGRLFLSLVNEQGSIIRQALLNLKVDPADIEKEVRRLMDGPA